MLDAPNRSSRAVDAATLGFRLGQAFSQRNDRIHTPKYTATCSARLMAFLCDNSGTSRKQIPSRTERVEIRARRMGDVSKLNIARARPDDVRARHFTGFQVPEDTATINRITKTRGLVSRKRLTQHFSPHGRTREDCQRTFPTTGASTRPRHTLKRRWRDYANTLHLQSRG